MRSCLPALSQNQIHYIADRQVILGNHRDAWVFGAVDPNSGTAALMSIASALGTMRKSSESSVATGSWSS